MMGVAVRETPQLDSALGVNTIRVVAKAVAFPVFSPLLDRDHGFLKMTRKNVVALVAGGAVALALGWFFLSYSLAATLESRAVPISSVTPLFRHC